MIVSADSTPYPACGWFINPLCLFAALLIMTLEYMKSKFQDPRDSLIKILFRCLLIYSGSLFFVATLFPVRTIKTFNDAGMLYSTTQVGVLFERTWDETYLYGFNECVFMDSTFSFEYLRSDIYMTYLAMIAMFTMSFIVARFCKEKKPEFHFVVIIVQFISTSILTYGARMDAVKKQTTIRDALDDSKQWDMVSHRSEYSPFITYIKFLAVATIAIYIFYISSSTNQADEMTLSLVSQDKLKESYIHGIIEEDTLKQTMLKQNKTNDKEQMLS